MRVALLSIENFRGIRSGKVQFRDHTVLVGPNNSGKTTIIEALALVLGRDRLVRDLTEHDFFGSNPGQRTESASSRRLLALDLMISPHFRIGSGMDAACRSGLTRNPAM